MDRVVRPCACARGSAAGWCRGTPCYRIRSCTFSCAWLGQRERAGARADYPCGWTCGRTPDTGATALACRRSQSGLCAAPSGTCGWTSCRNDCTCTALNLTRARILISKLFKYIIVVEIKLMAVDFNIWKHPPVWVYMWRASVPLSGQRASHSGQL